jgi:hypothetical protein
VVNTNTETRNQSKRNEEPKRCWERFIWLAGQTSGADDTASTVFPPEVVSEVVESLVKDVHGRHSTKPLQNDAHCSEDGQHLGAGDRLVVSPVSGAHRRTTLRHLTNMNDPSCTHRPYAELWVAACRDALRGYDTKMRQIPYDIT